MHHLAHNNGLVFGSRAYRALVRDHGLTQECIAPYTPEQNGLCERLIRFVWPAALPVGRLSPFGRLIRTFKEEGVWQQRFDNLAAARSMVARYIEHYNTRRTLSAFNYSTPRQTYLTLGTPRRQQAA